MRHQQNQNQQIHLEYFFDFIIIIFLKKIIFSCFYLVSIERDFSDSVQISASAAGQLVDGGE